MRPILVCVLGLLAAQAAWADVTFEFTLEGSQEVPPNASSAMGTAVCVLNGAGTQLTVDITHDVTSPTSAKIHFGLPGVNGPERHDLGSAASPIQTIWPLSAQDADDLLAGKLYVNIASAAFPGGEIRGQIVPDCRSSTVDSTSGSAADVLFVNGSIGDAQRTVTVPEGDLIWLTMLSSPAGGNGKFVVHANPGVPTGATTSVLPASVGVFCFPLLLSAGASPVAIWNNIGKENLVGSSEYFGSAINDPPRAPAIFLQLSFGDPANMPAGTTWTFQGVLLDPGSASPKGGSTTNAVILAVL
jgi:hypothetical protein